MQNENTVSPKYLCKYYSNVGIEKTIFDNTIKWEIPCEENDPFEALPSGWDLNAIKNAPGYRQGDERLLDAIFQAKEVQRKISHVAAFVSFTDTKREKDILMWAHYADKYRGACLEFDISHLLKIFKNGATLERVKYAEVRVKERERFPISLDDPDGTSPECQRHAIYFLSKKANEWTYEDECRLIATPVEAEFIKCIKDKDEDKYILVSDLPQGAITKLIFGYNMPVATRLALAKQIRIKHPNCRFAEVLPDRQRYELTIEPLELIARTDTAN